MQRRRTEGGAPDQDQDQEDGGDDGGGGDGDGDGATEDQLQADEDADMEVGLHITVSPAQLAHLAVCQWDDSSDFRHKRRASWKQCSLVPFSSLSEDVLPPETTDSVIRIP